MKKLNGQIYWIEPSIFPIKLERTKGEQIIQTTILSATFENDVLKISFRAEGCLYEILVKIKKGFYADGKYKNITDAYEDNVFFNFYENPKGIFLIGTWTEGVECTCLIQLFY